MLFNRLAFWHMKQGVNRKTWEMASLVPILVGVL